MKIQGFDEAIIGPALIWRENGMMAEVFVYDAEKIREKLMRDGMSSEDARKYIESHIEGAYIGLNTPVLVWTQDEFSDC